MFFLSFVNARVSTPRLLQLAPTQPQPYSSSPREQSYIPAEAHSFCFIYPLEPIRGLKPKYWDQPKGVDTPWAQGPEVVWKTGWWIGGMTQPLFPLALGERKHFNCLGVDRWSHSRFSCTCHKSPQSGQRFGLEVGTTTEDMHTSRVHQSCRATSS